MRIPYNCVATHGDILFASRGGQIQSFKLQGGPALSTWSHPEADREAAASVELAKAGSGEIPQAARAESSTAEDERPAKRQRAEPGPEVETSAVPQKGEVGEKSGQKGKGNKRDDGAHPVSGRNPGSKQPDTHVIILLQASADGRHIIAVSGQDKTLWVFEHDGNGTLKESSRRPMPKRPSALSISPDGRAIVVGDKFGDTYALPLDAADSLSGETTSLLVKHHRDPNKPTANEHTVHSKINLRSLEMQHRALERREKDAVKEEPKPEEPAFEHALVLGHVSMLTGLLVREYRGRRYIITCDRDEHIRVTRYIPQNYVIESFCLGHKEFINSMAVSETNPEILVSGGGDDALFVWDWPTGTLLSKTDILSHARNVSDVQHVAVSKIIYSNVGIFVICEGIPAVFQWTLSEARTLNNCRTLRLPGNPLDILVSSSPEPSLLVAIDSVENEVPSSLLAYAPADKECTSWARSATSFDESAIEGSVLEVSTADVKKLFYAIEGLRKIRIQEEE
ncbi:related to tRNA-methyltransferase [Cephalotrichum gorgonifer]|uniref:Related to tRNA-methyltransferase n=1 Tax=Cephalotrichum gorgonifer TaxID=2041049 RepID=A0AAE8MRK6_9PEZI|nr:related to tRNA-methyltransferase [Cephalotrichum gorgonifer]